jgi:nitroreductase
MDAIECIKSRRSIRKYEDRYVSDDQILELLDCARHGPFGGTLTLGCQLWEFIVVRDKGIKRALTHENSERMFVAESPVVIACCADTTKDPSYRDYDITVALAVENILLAATALGLATCYVTCYGNHINHKKERELLRRVLDLPAHIRLVCLVTVGYPREEPLTKPLRDLRDMIHHEQWRDKEEGR